MRGGLTRRLTGARSHAAARRRGGGGWPGNRQSLAIALHSLAIAACAAGEGRRWRSESLRPRVKGNRIQRRGTAPQVARPPAGQAPLAGRANGNKTKITLATLAIKGREAVRTYAL